jgi:hypothetical protein
MRPILIMFPSKGSRDQCRLSVRPAITLLIYVHHDLLHNSCNPPPTFTGAREKFGGRGALLRRPSISPVTLSAVRAMLNNVRTPVRPEQPSQVGLNVPATCVSFGQCPNDVMRRLSVSSAAARGVQIDPPPNRRPPPLTDLRISGRTTSPSVGSECRLPDREVGQTQASPIGPNASGLIETSPWLSYGPHALTRTGGEWSGIATVGQGDRRVERMSRSDRRWLHGN